MQQQNSKKWVRGVCEPFSGDDQKFTNIPKADRQAFIKELMQTPQIPSPPPYKFEVPFPLEGQFAYNDQKLRFHALEQTKSPKAIAILVHGLGSHGAAFGYLASQIAKINPELNIYAFDQLNFGLSARPYPGYIHSMEDSIAQVQTFRDFLLARIEGKPKIFLCGHSFGGAIIFNISLKSPSVYSGYILLAPALKQMDTNFYGRLFLKTLSWFIPRKILTLKYPPGLGTKYNLTQKFTTDKRFFTAGIVPGTMSAAFSGIDNVYKQLDKFIAPFLCIAAGKQKIIDPFGPVDLYEASPSTDKTLIYSESMWHVVMEEQEIVGVAWHCAHWIKERI